MISNLVHIETIHWLLAELNSQSLEDKAPQYRAPANQLSENSLLQLFHNSIGFRLLHKIFTVHTNPSPSLTHTSLIQPFLIITRQIQFQKLINYT
uniref:Uncharacterized protein n=1 Tax=Manihot esculenta TaxID=3983 RepID=A0A2C9W0Z1_MANES